MDEIPQECRADGGGITIRMGFGYGNQILQGLYIKHTQ
jgi:hypothetical protein